MEFCVHTQSLDGHLGTLLPIELDVAEDEKLTIGFGLRGLERAKCLGLRGRRIRGRYRTQP